MKVYMHTPEQTGEPRSTVYVDQGGHLLAVVETGEAPYCASRMHLPSTALELIPPAEMLEQMLDRVWTDEALDVPSFRRLLVSVAALPGGPAAIRAGDWYAALAAYDEAVSA